MPRRGPEGQDPSEIFPFPIGQTPEDDRAYFEMLSWFVSGSGLNWRVLRAKWPGFLKAFSNFNIAKVARYGEDDIDRLLADDRIIRNGKKVVGTVANAREMQRIAKEHGDMTAWLRSYRADTDGLLKDLKKRFSHMGDTTGRMFLTCVGAIEYQTWEPAERQKRGVP